MKIALDIRYLVRSGASTYIEGLLPPLLEQAGDDMRFMVISNVHTTVPECARHLPIEMSTERGMVSSFVWINTALPRILKKHKVDLYHSMKQYGPARKRLPTVQTMHGMIKPRSDEFPMSIKQKLWHSFYGKGRFRNSDAVIAISQYLGDFLQQDLAMPADRVAVIHNGINDKFCRELERQLAGTAEAPTPVPGLPAGKPFLLCLGNIEAVKNHATAVRALAQLRDELPHDLVIAGRPEKVAGAELKRVIQETGMNDRVHLIGFTEDVVNLLKSADLLIHPSTSEGLGFSILEAMACGVPVVTSDIPGTHESAGEAGCFVADPRDADGFAQAIKTTLADPQLMRQMAEAGRKRVRAFTWRRAAEQTLDVYRKCMAGAA